MENVEAFIYRHIPNLVSALGTKSADSYTLGYEGIGCLTDIKKWLLNYDTKSNKWEVAHAIAQTTLLESDLVNIIAAFYHNKIPEKAALLSLELITHLTWPLEIDPSLHSKKHEELLADLLHAQTRYKRAILTNPSHAVLRGAIALALPSIEKQELHRSSRDKSIINLVVNLARNILAITPEDRSAAILEFDSQKLFDFLILCFSSQDSLQVSEAGPLMDLLWCLTKSVNLQKLYTNKSEFSSHDRSLLDLLNQEKRIKASRFKPTRHSRFGTMISLDVDRDGNTLAVSGQRALGNDYLGAISDSKKWRKPKLANPHRREQVQWNNLSLSPQAVAALSTFVSRFLDTSYNPFFIRTKGFVGGFADEFDQNRIMAYVYTLGWFANAERLRNPTKMDFKLIGVALSHAMFTLICDILANNLEPGPLQSFDTVHAGMATLRVIFAIIDEMTRAPDHEWKDAAESMLARLFYDEARLDIFSKLPRIANKRTQSFQTEAIELVHSLLKLLDYYASDKAILFIKSKRRKENDDEETSEPKLRERKWDVDRYIKKFYHDSTIDLYQHAIETFQESDYKVLKHTLAFFHRLFIKKEMRALFYRLPFINALVRLTSTTSGIENAELFKGYHKFTAFYTKKLFECAEKSPSIFIEILFHKNRSDVAYYDQGIIGGVPISRKALEYEYEFVDSALEKDQKVKICAAALIEDNHRDVVEWVAETIKEHISLQQQEQKLRVFTESTTKLKELTKLPIARALLREMGLAFEHAQYFVPAPLGSFELIELSEVILKVLENGIEEDPHNYLSRSMANQGGDDEDEELMVPGGAPGQRAEESESSEDEDGFNDPRLQPLSAEEMLAKKREVHRRPVAKKKRRTMVDDSDSDSGSDPEEPQTKAAKPIVEVKSYKSSAFIHASDDEEDEERDRLFFEQELARQRDRNLLEQERADSEASGPASGPASPEC